MTSASIKNKIKDSFSRASKTYDKHSETHQNIANHLIHHCPERFPDGPIIDLGAGTGVLTQKLFKFTGEGSNLYALDISEQMLLTLDEQHKAVNLICGDIDSLPLAKNAFSLLASSTSLQWTEVKNIPQLILDSLKPQGVFAVAIILEGTFDELRRIKTELIEDDSSPHNLPKFEDLKKAFQNREALELVRYEKHNFISFYDSMNDLLSEIKNLGIGETNQKKLTATQLSTLKNKYQSYSLEKFERIALKYEVGFFWGRKLGE